MDAEKRSVRVTIFNQTYTLRSQGDPREVEQVAQYVDELMSSIASHTGSSDSTRAAVLACMHLADQLRTAQSDLASLRQSVDRRASRLSSLLAQVEA
jgi:cell division protein ZapA